MLMVARFIFAIAAVAPATVFAQANVGLIRVVCEGDSVRAEIFLNDVFKGECPVDIQAAEGLQVLRAVKPVDQRSERVFEDRFRLAAGTAKRVEVSLSKPQLNKEALAEQARARQAEQAKFDALLTAADAGDSGAQYSLARLYEKGGAIARQNSKQAMYWDMRAAGFGRERGGLIGLQLVDLDEKFRQTSGFGGSHGVVAGRATPNGPAARAGFQAADVVLQLDGTAVTKASDLIALIRNSKPGDKLNFVVWRKGEEVSVQTIAGERLGDYPFELPTDRHLLSAFLIFTHTDAVRKDLAVATIGNRFARLVRDANEALSVKKVDVAGTEGDVLSYIEGKEFFGTARSWTGQTSEATVEKSSIASGLINLRLHSRVKRFLQEDVEFLSELHRIDWVFGDTTAPIERQPGVWGIGWQIKTGSQYLVDWLLCGNKRSGIDNTIKTVEFDCFGLSHSRLAGSVSTDASRRTFKLMRVACHEGGACSQAPSLFNDKRFYAYEISIAQLMNDVLGR